MTHSAQKEKIVGGLTFLALLVVIFLSYGQKDDGVTPGAYQVIATFDRVDGLADDADVRMGGVKIGQVVASELNTDYRAVVQLSIDAEVALPLDTSAAIHTDGLFGAKFIELEPGGEEEMLKNGDQIDYTQRSVVVEELLDLIIAEGKAKRAQAQ